MNTEQERAALLPCPFCGGEPEIVKRDVEPQGDSWYGKKIEQFVECGCGACLFDELFHEGFYKAEEAIAAWNRRAALQSQDQEALTRLLAACPTTLHCDDFHHTKADQHMSGAYCPPLARYLAAIYHARRVENQP